MCISMELVCRTRRAIEAAAFVVSSFAVHVRSGCRILFQKCTSHLGNRAATTSKQQHGFVMIILQQKMFEIPYDKSSMASLCAWVLANAFNNVQILVSGSGAQCALLACQAVQKVVESDIRSSYPNTKPSSTGSDGCIASFPIKTVDKSLPCDGSPPQETALGTNAAKNAAAMHRGPCLTPSRPLQ